LQGGWRAQLAELWREDSVATPVEGGTGPRPRWQHSLVLACYALLIAVTTWPMLPHFATHIVSDGGDALMNYWGYWWVREALFSWHNPFETPYLYAPDGAPLYLHTLTLINGIISLPFQIFGLTVAYNAVVCICLLLAAYCAFLLVSYVSGHWVAGFVGGIVYAFGSYHMTHLLGHTNLLTSAWIPLAILCFLRAADAKGRRRTLFTLATTGALLLLILADWQYVIFASLTIAGLAIWLMLARRSLAPLLIVACAGVLAALVAAPLLVATVAEIRSGLVAPPDPGTARIYSADVVSFVMPVERHPHWGAWAQQAHARLPAPPVEGDIFLGFVPLALGLWALVFDRRRALRWAVLGLACAVLALGPILHVRGDWRWDGPNGTRHTIPMPYALAQQLPGLNFLRVPIRLSLLVTLALAVLGGIAVAHLAWRWPALGRPARAVPLVGLLAALLVFEHLAAPFPLEQTADAAVPPFYRALAASPEQGAILEWPLSFKRARSNFYQTVHHRPIMGGYVARRLAYPVRALPPFRDLPDPAGDIYMQPADAQNIGPWIVQWAGVRWIVVYRDDLDKRDLLNLQSNYADGPPIYEDETMLVFRPRTPVGTATAIVGGGGWYGPERLSDGVTAIHWFESSGEFKVWHFGATEEAFALRFDAWSFHQPRRLEVWLDGQRLGEWRVSDIQRFDIPITLASGPHRVELRSLDPALSPASLGYPGQDTRPLAFAISNVRLER